MTEYKAQLSDKQKLALRHLGVKSEVSSVLYGGGAGGGKSWLGCYWQIMRRLKYPNTRGMICRNELKELKLTTMNTFWTLVAEMGMKSGIHYKYNEQMSVIKWFNGSETVLAEIEFRPSDPDYNYLGSYELTDAFVDEAPQVPSRGLQVLATRIRWHLIDRKPKLLMTANPCKGYLYNEYYKASLEGKIKPSRVFIQALLSDNTMYADRDIYRQQLENETTERDRRRLLDGDWDYDDSPDLLFDRIDMNQMFVSGVEASGTPYITCDPAAMGNDRTIIAIWKGMDIVKFYEYTHKFPHEVANELRELASMYQCPLRNVIVDSDGLGVGVYGILKCTEFQNGSQAIDSKRYANLKSECYFKLSENIKNNKVRIHDHRHQEDIMKELDLVRDRTKEDKKRDVSKKEEIKKYLGHSPDYADAIMMRMYFELKPNRGKYAYA